MEIKIVCIEEPYRTPEITIGRIYEANIVNDSYEITFYSIGIDNAVNPHVMQQYAYKLSIPQGYFITLAEWRQQQIDKILNDD
jgi:hypothetical protein